MAIKNLHHLGVPCISKIKQKDSGKVKDIESNNLNRGVILRTEPNGGVLTTPGLYASFLWIDSETIDLIKKENFSSLELNDLYMLSETDCLSKSPSSAENFRVDINGLPNQVLFEVTSDCNCDCLSCYHKTDLNLGQPETRDLIRRVDILANLGLSLFEVTGGEPFLRFDLTTILDEIKFRGRNFYIVTNGSLLKFCKDKTIETLRKGEGLAISIDGFGEKHDSIRKLPGLFSDIEEGLKTLEGSGVRIYFVSTIGKHNYRDIPALLDFASKYKAVLHLRPAIRTGSALENKLISENIHNFLAQYLSHPSAKNGFLATKKEIPESKQYGCGIRKRISVDSFGNLFPCVMDRSGKLERIESYSPETLVKTLEQEARRYLNSSPLCRECEINKEELVCGGFCRFSKSYQNGTAQKL